MTDRIEVRGLRVHGRHGVHEVERRDGQTFVVDVELDVDLAPAVASDALEDTVDYADLAERLADAVRRTRFALIESLAGHLADVVLADARVTAVRVRVAKPEARVPVELDELAVVVARTRG